MKKLLSKKISVKSLLVLLLVIACVSVTLAAAHTQISALLTPEVKITYDGVVKIPRDGNGNVMHPINYNGGIYLPVRGMAGILGIDIDWDQETKTVLLGDGASGGAAVQPASGTLPADGGQVRVNGITRYDMTPETSGYWSFRTSECIRDDDPMITVFDPAGKVIAEDDDSNWELNALVFVKLEAGSLYTIEVSFYDGPTGRCTLTAAPAQTLPSSGGTVRVNGITAYIFTPDRTGEWTISTSENGDSDPYLSLCDAHGNYIDDNDDGGDDKNALLTMQFTAGETYIIDADFYGGETGSYTLTVE